MTPLKKGINVQIDPTIANRGLAYGIIDPIYYKKIGKIVNSSYSRKFKIESYQVQYEDGKKYWFIDGELI